MIKWYISGIIILTSGFTSVLFSQEIKIFKVDDFDLNGPVESALVITDYGKEEYHFDKKGRLTKAVTRYSDDDYENTFYKYSEGELIEKRVENYRDNTFDPSTSIANFYQIDSMESTRRVVENIVSYEKEPLEKNTYLYDQANALVKIVHTDANGTDEITIDYNRSEEGTVMNKKRNSVLQQSVRTSEIDSTATEIVTDKYINGDLTTRKKEVLSQGELVSEMHFTWDDTNLKWAPESETNYTYDKDGVLSQTITKRGTMRVAKQYIYQFDGTPSNNWVKEIITPDNSYTTRRIQYFEIPEKKEE